MVNPKQHRKVEQYTDAFVGEIMSEYAEGSSSFALSKRFGVPTSTIETWAVKYGISRGARVSPNAQQEIGQALIRLVVKQIETHGILLQRTQDPEWFKSQSAGDVALLISTIHEKNIQLLGSLQAGQKQEIERIEMDPDYDPVYSGDTDDHKNAPGKQKSFITREDALAGASTGATVPLKYHPNHQDGRDDTEETE